MVALSLIFKIKSFLVFRSRCMVILVVLGPVARWVWFAIVDKLFVPMMCYCLFPFCMVTRPTLYHYFMRLNAYIYQTLLIKFKD